MSQKSSNTKALQNDPGGPSTTASAGPNGAAISPPAYGIPVIDQIATEPASDRQEGNSSASIQLKAALSGAASDPGRLQVNRTGLPSTLKSGVEALSGLSLDDVRVHYNSPQPAQLQALAYTQGTEIHVAPGQERHLPHEAWHVVQQKQGRVSATGQLKGTHINDDTGLEREATQMGVRASRSSLLRSGPGLLSSGALSGQTQPVQRVKIEDVEVGKSYDLHGKVVKVISKSATQVNIEHEDGSKTDEDPADLLALSYEKLGKGRKQHIGFTLHEGFSMPKTNKRVAIFGASEKRKKRSFNSEKEIQALRWVATVFFHLAIDNGKAPEEVQAGLYKDQIIISSNTQTANNFLAGRRIGNAGADILAAANALKKSEERIKRHSYKVKASIVGLNKTNKALATAFTNPLIVITSEDKDNPGLHAERRIAAYIDEKEKSADAYLNYPIAGVKRPCTSCFLKLYYQKKPKAKHYPKSVGPHWSSTAANIGLDTTRIEQGEYSIPRSAVTETRGGVLSIDEGSESESDMDVSYKEELAKQEKKRRKVD